MVENSNYTSKRPFVINNLFLPTKSSNTHKTCLPWCTVKEDINGNIAEILHQGFIRTYLRELSG